MQARFFQFVLSHLDPHTLLIVRRITPVEHYQWKDSWAVGWASFVLSAVPGLMCVLTYFAAPILAFTTPFILILSLIFAACAIILAFQAATIATTRIYPDALQLLTLSHLSHSAILQGCFLSALAKMRELAAVLVALLPGFLMITLLGGWQVVSKLPLTRHTGFGSAVVFLYAALLPVRLLGMSLLGTAVGVWTGTGRSAGPLPALSAIAITATVLLGCEGLLMVGLQMVIIQETSFILGLLSVVFSAACIVFTAAPFILTWYLMNRHNPSLSMTSIRVS
jgi:hypothetical protein